MADKLLIIMMNSNPEESMEVVPPISQAIVAAAMEFEVEVIFSGRTAGLACPGAAEKVQVAGNKEVTAYDLIKEAVEAGVSFKMCAKGVEFWGEEMIPEIDETVGDTYIISEAMDSDTVTFTY